MITCRYNEMRWKFEFYEMADAPTYIQVSSTFQITSSYFDHFLYELSPRRIPCYVIYSSFGCVKLQVVDSSLKNSEFNKTTVHIKHSSLSSIESFETLSLDSRHKDSITKYHSVDQPDREITSVADSVIWLIENET